MPYGQHHCTEYKTYICVIRIRLRHDDDDDDTSHRDDAKSDGDGDGDGEREMGRWKSVHAKSNSKRRK